MGTVASASLRPPAAVTAPAGGAEGAVAATARIPPTSHCLAGQKGATAPTTVAITTTSVCLHRDPNSGHQKLNQYELLREIGRGVHGKVRLARDTLTGQHYAIKVIDKVPGSKRANASLLSRNRSSLSPERSSALPEVEQRFASATAAASSLAKIHSAAAIIHSSASSRSAAHKPLGIIDDDSSCHDNQLDAHDSHLAANLPCQRRSSLNGALPSRPVFALTTADDSASSLQSAGPVAARPASPPPSPPLDAAALRSRYKAHHRRRLSITSQIRSVTDDSHLRRVRREVAVLRRCRHENVVALKEVIDSARSRRIYLVLEYADGGEIRWRDGEERPVLSLDEVRQIFRGLVNAVEYLHSQGIIHRDIKPANLLHTRSGQAKLSDFGVSCIYRSLPTATAATAAAAPPTPVQNTAGGSLNVVRTRASHVWRQLRKQLKRTAHITNTFSTAATAEPVALYDSADQQLESNFDYLNNPFADDSDSSEECADDDIYPIPTTSLRCSSSGGGGLWASAQGTVLVASNVDDCYELTVDASELARTVGSPAFFAPELCLTADQMDAYLLNRQHHHSKPKSIGPILINLCSRSLATPPSPLLTAERQCSRGHDYNRNAPIAIEGHNRATEGRHITPAIDVWAMGVTLYCLVYGRVPFSAANEYELLNVIPNAELAFPKDNRVPASLKQLLCRMLEKDYGARISVSEIKKCRWLAKKRDSWGKGDGQVREHDAPLPIL